MLVHELAALCGVSTDTVRYYTRIGLLNPNRDPDNGYRHYQQEDIRRLEFIRRSRQLGLMLTDIANLLAQHETHDPECCDKMSLLLRQRLEDNRQQVEALMLLQTHMQQTLTRLEGGSKPDNDSCAICPFLTVEDSVKP